MTIALVAAIISGSLSAVAVTNLLRRGSSAVTNEPTGSAVSKVHIDESSAVITAVARVMPAVVVIESRSSGGVLGGANGTGSGFIFDSNGWILTNKHVVQGADEISVQLNDSRVFTARVYGIDTLTDLAIIKIDATGLPVAQLGSSEELQLGQLAIAIGNPLGNFENTVTTGVVSGLGRQIQAGDSSGSSSEQLNNLIQTDAAINPGNSGGPLINSAGQVIGINTAVNQDAQGIGFAIPISVARPIVQLALAGKEIARPWIGVYYKLVNAQIAKDLGLSVDHGVLIDKPVSGAPAIFVGSPADKAGLQEGDVVTAVDGQVVDENHDLSTRILPHVPGDTVTLSVVRGSKTMEVSVTLATLPTTP
jgi:S1-C subfamily serine protease